ncbi:hypothetical protein B0H63DRAFT_518516 [Podospora didyma]|uniref:Uncharacterized protein n=1 Tax=Podospora didyma TaxID=330526 RepID=A0AAE0NWY9_9PEZI|nr:hypothetical protein B0H63DRAFT_518516 [Podospora didyma]
MTEPSRPFEGYVPAEIRMEITRNLTTPKDVFNLIFALLASEKYGTSVGRRPFVRSFVRPFVRVFIYIALEKDFSCRGPGGAVRQPPQDYTGVERFRGWGDGRCPVAPGWAIWTRDLPLFKRSIAAGKRVDIYDLDNAAESKNIWRILSRPWRNPTVGSFKLVKRFGATLDCMALLLVHLHAIATVADERRFRNIRHVLNMVSSLRKDGEFHEVPNNQRARLWQKYHRALCTLLLALGVEKGHWQEDKKTGSLAPAEWRTPEEDPEGRMVYFDKLTPYVKDYRTALCPSRGDLRYPSRHLRTGTWWSFTEDWMNKVTNTENENKKYDIAHNL